jgi:hypothetical protein
MTRSTSIAASVESYRSVQSTEDDWNIETLREMTDVVREALQLGSLPSAPLEILSEILKALLFDSRRHIIPNDQEHCNLRTEHSRDRLARNVSTA